ncbi:MAG: hypothetical protein R2813_12740 [Flavobacteriales bacterium]
MKLKNFLPFLALLALLTSLSSCDKCRGLFGREKVECSNGGTCNGGICDCLRGYAGANCDLLDFCELYEVECIQGVCEGGYCICEEGYELDDCSYETRAKFMGSWAVVEYCVGLDTLGTTLVFERDDVFQDKFWISTLFHYDQFRRVGVFSPVQAVATPESNKFTIPSQKPDDTSKTISGSGTIDSLDANNIEITINYFHRGDGTSNDTCVVKGKFIIPTP